MRHLFADERMLLWIGREVQTTETDWVSFFVLMVLSTSMSPSGSMSPSPLEACSFAYAHGFSCYEYGFSCMLARTFSCCRFLLV